MNLSIMILFIFGTVLVVQGYMQSKTKCPKNRIEYRFIPRDLNDMNENPQLPSKIYADMFSQPSIDVLNVANLSATTRNTQDNNTMYYTAVI